MGNVLVVMTLFNEVNCRKLYFEKCWATFEGIHKNIYYIVIMAGQWILHILLVQFSGRVFQCSSELGMKEWGIAFGFGIGTLIWQQVIIIVGTAVDPNIAATEQAV